VTAGEEGITNVRFEQGDAQVFPFGQGDFDVAISQPILVNAAIGSAKNRIPPHLPGREAVWGDSPQSAQRFILALDAEQQARTTAAWNDETCYQVNEVVRRCFPDGTPHDEMPAEIRELLIEQRWQRGGLDIRVGLVPALIRALRIVEHVATSSAQLRETRCLGSGRPQGRPPTRCQDRWACLGGDPSGRRRGGEPGDGDGGSAASARGAAYGVKINGRPTRSACRAGRARCPRPSSWCERRTGR
jgi:hypothetical protein